MKADAAFDRADKDASHSGWVRDVAWAPRIGLPGQASGVVVVVCLMRGDGFIFSVGGGGGGGGGFAETGWTGVGPWGIFGRGLGSQRRGEGAPH